jgi:hypothetical protein
MLDKGAHLQLPVIIQLTILTIFEAKGQRQIRAQKKNTSGIICSINFSLETVVIKIEDVPENEWKPPGE